MGPDKKNHPNRSRQNIPPNLVQSWFAAKRKPGMTKAETIRQHLNPRCATQYDMKVVGKWERGDRSIPQEVQIIMMTDIEVLEWAITAEIGDVVLDPGALKNIAQRITPTPRRGGSV